MAERHPLARTNAHQARLQFATWLKEKHPDIYSAALRRAEKWRREWGEARGNAATLEGLGAEGETQSFWDKFREGVTTLGTTYLTYKTQRDAMDLNMTRAEQGLPPIDTSFAAPVVRTQIDLTPEVATRLQETGTDMLQKVLIFGGLAVAAVLIVTKMK